MYRTTVYDTAYASLYLYDVDMLEDRNHSYSTVSSESEIIRSRADITSLHPFASSYRYLLCAPSSSVTAMLEMTSISIQTEGIPKSRSLFTLQPLRLSSSSCPSSLSPLQFTRILRPIRLPPIAIQDLRPRMQLKKLTESLTLHVHTVSHHHYAYMTMTWMSASACDR